jgi:hypothetical protein
MRKSIALLIIAFAMPSVAHAQFYDSDCTPEYASHIISRYMNREQGSESWVVELHRTCQAAIQRSGVGGPGQYNALNMLQPHVNAVLSGNDNRPPPPTTFSGGGGVQLPDMPSGCPPGQTSILGFCQ